MLKTIPTNQVKLGMHLHALAGAWVNHPFWKTNFIINDAIDLKKIQQSGVKEVVIDISKGLDVVEQPQIKVASNRIKLQEQDTSKADKQTTSISLQRNSLREEHAQASKIVDASKKAIRAMFKDVRMGNAINTESLNKVVHEISSSVARHESALISLVRLKNKDDYTYMHSVAVCALMVALSRQLQLSESETKQAGLAGLTHDIGKAGIAIEVLNKPGALTDDEFSLVKLHPDRGHDILLAAQIADKVVLDVCLHHHEKIDGSGYPDKLQGDQISFFAKMGAVCDVYDAITSNRPYKEGWDPSVSLQRMAQWKGHFDEVIFKAFVKSLGIYPIGSTIKLKSGRLAIVVDQSPKSLLKPIVRVFFSTKSKSRIPMQTIDLSKPNEREEIIGHEDPVLWGINDINHIWSQFEIWD